MGLSVELLLRLIDEIFAALSGGLAWCGHEQLSQFGNKQSIPRDGAVG